MLYIVEDSEKFELRIDKYSFNELLLHQHVTPAHSQPHAPVLNYDNRPVEPDIT